MYKLDHIHIKGPDPKVTAQWYVDNFDARIVGEGQSMGGAHTVRLDIGGTHVNVSSGPAGPSLPQGSADQHYGFEHFGLGTDDIVGDIERLESKGVEVLVPVTQLDTGNRIAFVRGPDEVRIELVQPGG